MRIGVLAPAGYATSCYPCDVQRRLVASATACHPFAVLCSVLNKTMLLPVSLRVQMISSAIPGRISVSAYAHAVMPETDTAVPLPEVPRSAGDSDLPQHTSCSVSDIDIPCAATQLRVPHGKYFARHKPSEATRGGHLDQVRCVGQEDCNN